MYRKYLVLLLLSLASCWSDNVTYELLQGSWQNEYYVRDTIKLSESEYRFSDSSFFIDNGPHQAHSTISWWTVENNKLRIYHKDILQIDTIKFKILSIDESHMELEDEIDGSIFNLYKIEE